MLTHLHLQKLEKRGGHEACRWERFTKPESGRLLPHARTPSDFRFLMGRAPAVEFEEAVIRAVPDSLGLRQDLQGIRRRLQT